MIVSLSQSRSIPAERLSVANSVMNSTFFPGLRADSVVLQLCRPMMLDNSLSGSHEMMLEHVLASKDSTITPLIEGVNSAPVQHQEAHYRFPVVEYALSKSFSSKSFDLCGDSYNQYTIMQTIFNMRLNFGLGLDGAGFTAFVEQAGVTINCSNGSAINGFTTLTGLSEQDVRSVSRQLRLNGARYFTQPILPSENIGTTSNPPAYIMICSEKLKQDFQRLSPTEFVPAHLYSGHTAVFGYSEIGSLPNANMRVLTTQNSALDGKKGTGDGLSYQCLVFSAENQVVGYSKAQMNPSQRDYMIQDEWRTGIQGEVDIQEAGLSVDNISKAIKILMNVRAYISFGLMTPDACGVLTVASLSV